MPLINILTALCIAFYSCAYPVTENGQVTEPKSNQGNSVADRGVDTTVVPASKEEINSDFLMGKFNYRKHPLFKKVPAPLCAKEVYIQIETLQAFQRMYEAALRDTVTLQIVSGTRNFAEQKEIWERKWNKEIAILKNPKATALRILEYSSMPSTSRHHWGTDIDINSVDGAYFKKGKGLREFRWLTANANQFGFYQTYTPKDKGRTGYSVEEWHWSYMPLAQTYLQRYNNLISNKDIKGFLGYETATEIDIIKNFVNGIERYP